MRIFTLAAALAAMAACSAPKTKVQFVGNSDLASYRRIAVLPFTDEKGRGRFISDAIAKGLPARGFETPDSKVIESVFSKFKLDKDLGLGITELSEIRSVTQAQAILTGSVEPGGARASAILLDTDEGEAIFKATLIPAHKGPFASTSEIADQALSLFAALPKRQQ